MYKPAEHTSLGGYSTSPASNVTPDHLASLINSIGKDTSVGQMKVNDVKNKRANVPIVFEDEGSILSHMASSSSQIHGNEKRITENITISDNNISTMETTTLATKMKSPPLLATMIFSSDNDAIISHKKGLQNIRILSFHVVKLAVPFFFCLLILFVILL